MLSWAREALGARFILVEGVIHRDQPPEAIAAIERAIAVHAADPVALTALHMLTTITGSVVLALAFANGAVDEDRIWALAPSGRGLEHRALGKRCRSRGPAGGAQAGFRCGSGGLQSRKGMRKRVAQARNLTIG